MPSDSYFSKEEFLSFLAEEGITDDLAEECWQGWVDGGRLAALSRGKNWLDDKTPEGEREAIRIIARMAKDYIDLQLLAERHRNN